MILSRSFSDPEGEEGERASLASDWTRCSFAAMARRVVPMLFELDSRVPRTLEGEGGAKERVEEGAVE
jgi:hypothetical protein